MKLLGKRTASVFRKWFLFELPFITFSENSKFSKMHKNLSPYENDGIFLFLG